MGTRPRTGTTIVLGAFALALALGSPGARLAAPPEPTPPLPDKARAVLYFDLARLRTSDLYKDVQEKIGLFSRSNERLQTFLQATGLVTAAGSVQSFTLYSVAGQKDFAGMISAGFAPETMTRLEQAYAPVARKASGHVIMPVIQTPEVEVVMSFVGPGRLAFGTAPAVEAVVGATGSAGGLQAAMARTETRRPIWGVIDAREMVASLTDAARENGTDASPLKAIIDSPALKSLVSVGFSVELGRDVFFELRALTDTPENARLLADAIKGMVALGQMGVSQAGEPELRGFFRDMIAESERDGVYVSFTLSEAQINRLKQSGDLFSGVAP
jgi:hypothetical protein